MEGILGLVGIFALYWVGSIIFGGLFSAGKATVKTVVGKGSFSDNMRKEFKGMDPFEIRVREEKFGENNDQLAVLIEGRGLIPNSKSMNVQFVTSVFDATGDDLKPVLAHYEDFQEERTFAYQAKANFGQVEVNQGFTDWVRVGVVLPDILDTPQSGRRDLKFVLRLVDADNPAEIQLGYCSTSGVWTDDLDYQYQFERKGYEESSEDRERANLLGLQLGDAVAMADGGLHESEGAVLKEWIMKKVAPLAEERQAKLKDKFNAVMREAYEQAKEGDLSLSNITRQMRELGETECNLDALKLGYEVMSADGKADKEELETIKRIADTLGIDPTEQEKYKDQHILKIDSSLSSDDSPEALVGMDPSWNKEQIAAHLRDQFQKWNGRLNILEEGSDRDQAQRVINVIGELRTKYVG